MVVEGEEITHLCFAGDLMIFYKAEVALVSSVRYCLNQFRVASSYHQTLIRVICSCVMLILIQKYSFSIFSATGKENY
jgi:hypothetical protein